MNYLQVLNLPTGGHLKVLSTLSDKPLHNTAPLVNRENHLEKFYQTFLMRVLLFLLFRVFL